MKNFFCSHCGAQVFFQNDQCVTCSKPLGFAIDSMSVDAFDPQADGRWLRLTKSGPEKSFRPCQNNKEAHVCNWMIASETPATFCASCALTEVIPDLSDPANLERWNKIEAAKRRCIYTLLQLRLPMEASAGGAPALRFRFLGNAPSKDPVKTGHQNGIITLNIAEADEDEREKRRLQFHEPYRTLLGHFRHEVGHYYWDRLIQNTPRLERFRQLFGDERADYGAALANYYRTGPAADWPQRTVTAYAGAHPWEDWAETWANYLHIIDTMETADSFGLRLESAPAPGPNESFDDFCGRWMTLSCALNSVNRGMGLSDLYPFVITPAVREKLRFVKETIESART